MTVLRLAMAQEIPPSRDVSAGLQRVIRLIDTAVSAGANWLLLPELFIGGYQLENVAPLALQARGPEVHDLAQAATAVGIGLQVGFSERDGEAIYDSTVTILPSGEAAIYRKTHLFGRESEVFLAGGDLPLLPGETAVAPLICYDIEFPEPARVAALSGASLILVSTANMEPFGDQQILFARTRALENQIFVAVCNRVGDESGFHFCGRSIVADPFGGVLALAGEEEALLLVDCDLDKIAGARRKNDYRHGRRAELYGALVGVLADAGSR